MLRGIKNSSNNICPGGVGFLCVESTMSGHYGIRIFICEQAGKCLVWPVEVTGMFVS